MCKSCAGIFRGRDLLRYSVASGGGGEGELSAGPAAVVAAIFVDLIGHLGDRRTTSHTPFRRHDEHFWVDLLLLC